MKSQPGSSATWKEKTGSTPKGSQPSQVSLPTTERPSPKFFLMSYAPHTLTEELVNIAVMIVGDGFADVRFADDWRRVVSLDPGVDIELLTGLACEIRTNLRSEGREEMLRMMQDSWSNTIRLSSGKGCLTDDAATEIETLALQYL